MRKTKKISIILLQKSIKISLFCWFLLSQNEELYSQTHTQVSTVLLYLFIMQLCSEIQTLIIFNGSSMTVCDMQVPLIYILYPVSVKVLLMWPHLETPTKSHTDVLVSTNCKLHSYFFLCSRNKDGKHEHEAKCLSLMQHHPLIGCFNSRWYCCVFVSSWLWTPVL